MSAIALQRVVVRMMYDATFRQRVYADPLRALHDVPLTPQERQWLVTPKPSAYGADAYRSSRALSGLLEEFPVAGALAARLPRGIQRLQQFFAAQVFHQCVQERGSMAMAFGRYLGSAAFRSRHQRPEMAHIATAETGMACVRRATPRPHSRPASITDDTPLGLAPWVELIRVHPDTLTRYSTILTRLRQHRGTLVEAVLDTTYALPPPGAAFRGKATAYVLISQIPGSEGPSLESATDDLGRLLTTVETPMRWGDVSKVVEDMGCEPQEAQEVLSGLVDDRILICL